MDGDGGEMAGGEMGGMNGGGGGGTNGKYGIGMESSDEDSPTASLQSMGYIDDETEMDGADGDATNSGLSALQLVVIVLVTILGTYALYSVATGILAVLGVQL